MNSHHICGQIWVQNHSNWTFTVVHSISMDLHPQKPQRQATTLATDCLGCLQKKKSSAFLHLFLFYFFVYFFFFFKKASWSYQSFWGETFSHNSSLLFKFIRENSTFISVRYSIFSLSQYPIERCCDYQYMLVFSKFDFFPLFNTIISVNFFLFQNFDCRISTFTTFVPSEWIEQNISG